MATHKGSITRISDAALLVAGLLVAIGSSANHFKALSAVTDVPLGTCPDTPDAGGDAAILLLGCADETQEMIASEAITAGEKVFAGVGGKVTDLPAVAGTYFCVGTALIDAAADGDIIEVDPCSPVAVVVV